MVYLKCIGSRIDKIIKNYLRIIITYYFFYLKAIFKKINMKIAYIFLYSVSGLIFLTALLGNSFTKPVFNSISEKTLELSGFRKSYIESVDDKLDELVYKSRQIELQIEKIKKFFSSEKVDENLYKKEKSALLERTFYDPLILLFNYVFRLGFVFLSFLFLFSALIFHLAYRSSDLRNRVRYLESIVLAQR